MVLTSSGKEGGGFQAQAKVSFRNIPVAVGQTQTQSRTQAEAPFMASNSYAVGHRWQEQRELTPSSRSSGEIQAAGLS